MVQNVQLMSVVPKMTRIDNPVIGFSEKDARRLHHPHDDALVVSIWIRDYNTYWILVDNESSADILYYPAFQQMWINKEHLVPTNAPLVRFGVTKVYSLRAVTLPVTVGDYPQQITKDITFLVVDCSSAYNAILGWPTLNSWKPITSTYHLMIQIPHRLWGRGSARRSNSCTRMLYHNVRDGWPSTDHEHRRAADDGGTSRKT